MKPPPVATVPKFSQMLIDLRAGLQAHADAVGEVVEIDYRLPEGKPIKMRFRPGAGAESPEATAAKSQPPTTPSQATPGAPAKESPPLTPTDHVLLARIVREAVRSLPPKDLAAHLRKFPQDRHFL